MSNSYFREKQVFSFVEFSFQLLIQHFFVFFKPTDYVYVSAACMCDMDTTLDVHVG